MKILILGVAGTFMAGIARLAIQMGHSVEGVDEKVYPPMSDVLTQMGIVCHQGYAPAVLDGDFDQVIVGNVFSRGQPIIETMLNKGVSYSSGPQWLYDQLLKDRRVIAVAGTHGKTTTTSLLISLMRHAGHEVGYLVGGKPNGFEYSADLGDSDCFVIEADEYDTAFFDKRSKFMHYRPESVIINHLEFDHADIFASFSDIQRSFQQLMAMVPSNGWLLSAHAVSAIEETLKDHCWCQHERFGVGQGDWQARDVQDQGSSFALFYQEQCLGQVDWPMFGSHNVRNALAAAAMAFHHGLSPEQIVAGLAAFKGLKRRLEYKGDAAGIALYDDFAHHPTAIDESLAALRARIQGGRLVVLLQLASYTMCQGSNQAALLEALRHADAVFMTSTRPLAWDPEAMMKSLQQPCAYENNQDDLLSQLKQYLKNGDHFICLGNNNLEYIFNSLKQ